MGAIDVMVKGFIGCKALSNVRKNVIKEVTNVNIGKKSRIK